MYQAFRSRPDLHTTPDFGSRGCVYRLKNIPIDSRIPQGTPIDSVAGSDLQLPGFEQGIFDLVLNALDAATDIATHFAVRTGLCQ